MCGGNGVLDQMLRPDEADGQVAGGTDAVCEHTAGEAAGTLGRKNLFLLGAVKKGKLHLESRDTKINLILYGPLSEDILNELVRDSDIRVRLELASNLTILLGVFFKYTFGFLGTQDNLAIFLSGYNLQQSDENKFRLINLNDSTTIDLSDKRLYMKYYIDGDSLIIELYYGDFFLAKSQVFLGIDYFNLNGSGKLPNSIQYVTGTSLEDALIYTGIFDEVIDEIPSNIEKYYDINYHNDFTIIGPTTYESTSKMKIWIDTDREVFLQDTMYNLTLVRGDNGFTYLKDEDSGSLYSLSKLKKVLTLKYQGDTQLATFTAQIEFVFNGNVVYTYYLSFNVDKGVIEEFKDKAGFDDFYSFAGSDGNIQYNVDYIKNKQRKLRIQTFGFEQTFYSSGENYICNFSGNYYIGGTCNLKGYSLFDIMPNINYFTGGECGDNFTLYLKKNINGGIYDVDILNFYIKKKDCVYTQEEYINSLGGFNISDIEFGKCPQKFEDYKGGFSLNLKSFVSDVETGDILDLDFLGPVSCIWGAIGYGKKDTFDGLFKDQTPTNILYYANISNVSISPSQENIDFFYKIFGLILMSPGILLLYLVLFKI